MPYIEKIAIEKARKINNSSVIYGTFAEIGAGQEVVNYFFKAGQASQTVAKSMSAYDMTFSDQIYGKAGRYVSEHRLLKMLEHEYDLLQKRLKNKRGHNTKFFAFANTVAVSTTDKSQGATHHHGWMGVRFQNDFHSPYNEMILHVNLLDKTRLQQYEALGVLGVNLIYSAFYEKKEHKNIIKSFFNNIEPSRIDINMLRCSGNIFKNLNHQQLNLELIRQSSTDGLLFQDNHFNILPSDALYEKHIVLMCQHPNSNLSQYIKKSISYTKQIKNIKKKPVLLVNIPMQYSKDLMSYSKKYLSSSDKHKYLLVSDFKKLYELKNFIRTATEEYIFILIDNKTLKTILAQIKSHHEALDLFSRLCDTKTILMVPDHNEIKLSKNFYHLEQHLIKNKQLVYIK